MCVQCVHLVVVTCYEGLQKKKRCDGDVPCAAMWENERIIFVRLCVAPDLVLRSGGRL